MAHRFPASDCSTAGVSRRSSPFRVRRTVGLSLNSAPGAGEPMDQAGNPDERDSSVVAVAAVSLVAGLACTLAPAATARLAGIDANPGVVCAVGLVDLALARGLYVGRPSWPWLLARAPSNPAGAAVSLASARSPPARP